MVDEQEPGPSKGKQAGRLWGPMGSLRSAILAGLVWALSGAPAAEAAGTQAWEADSTIATSSEGHVVKEYFGLKLTSGVLALTAAHAIYRDWQDRLECEDGVTFRDTAQVLTCRNLIYSTGSERASASGGVEFVSPRHILRAGQIDYDRKARSLAAAGDASLEDREHKVRLTGLRLDYDESKRTGVMEGRPARATREKDRLSIGAGRIRFALDDASLEADGDVGVSREQVTANGDAVSYDDLARRMRVTGHSRMSWIEERSARATSGRMSGDEIVISLQDTLLHEICSAGSARASWTSAGSEPSDRYVSLLKADSVKVMFGEDSRPKSVVARGRATSVHGAGGASTPDRLKADEISVDIREEDRMVVTARGAAEGIYTDAQEGRDRGTGHVRGDEIRILMEDRRVKSVEVTGDVAGVYTAGAKPER